MKLNKIMILFFAATLGVCSGGPIEITGDNSELFEENWNIVWARCVSAEFIGNARVDYTFEVIETLRGTQKQRFQIHRDTINWQRAEDEVSSFRSSVKKDWWWGHTDKSFWDNPYLGRCFYLDDYSLNISFNVGREYLIFLDEPYNERGFEAVDSENDKWYLYVKQMVEEQKSAEEGIKISAQLRQADIYAQDLTKKYPECDVPNFGGSIYRYVCANRDATNADIKRKVEELFLAYKAGSDGISSQPSTMTTNSPSLVENGGTSRHPTLTTNPPPRGAAGSGEEGNNSL